MQFRVPQFIDVEDKLVGPLTLKQFLWLAGAAGILIILWFFLTLGAFILAAILIVGAACALSFYKVNGQPLISFVGSFLTYISKPRLYLWKRKK